MTTPMNPSTKARTRQREQGALKAETATKMEPPMTRQKQRDGVNKIAEWAYKPGSVVNGHLSCLHVTVQLHARYPNADRAGP